MRFYTLILPLIAAFTTQSFASAEQNSDKSKGSCTAWQEECAKSKDPKSCFPGRCGAWGEYDYSTIDIEEGELYQKPSDARESTKATKQVKKTKNKKAQKIKAPKIAKKKKMPLAISCKTAFLAAQKSPSTGEVMGAIETCENATQKMCAKNYDGTGDGRYVTAACMLNAAHKGNMAVNKDQATAKCEKAFQEGTNSPSTGDLKAAIDTCKEETQAICAKFSNGTGDGRLVAANCGLTAAHGGFLGITSKEKKKAESKSCTNCRDNMNHDMNHDAIDIYEGESKADGAQ